MKNTNKKREKLVYSIFNKITIKIKINSVLFDLNH